MSTITRQWARVRDLKINQQARHAGCYQTKDGRVRPTRTADIDRGVWFIHCGHHSITSSHKDVIFGLDDVVETFPTSKVTRGTRP